MTDVDPENMVIVIIGDRKLIEPGFGDYRFVVRGRASVYPGAVRGVPFSAGR
jgi:hypothetical protein